MKAFFKTLLGFNAISLMHLTRLDLARFVEACSMAFRAARRASTGIVNVIPETSLTAVIGNRVANIQLSVKKPEDGLLPSEQAMVLLSIIVAENPKEILEIGTYMGHTTRQIAENLQNAIVHTVDLPEDFSLGEKPSVEGLPMDDFHLISRRIVGRDFRNEACSSRIRQYFGDTAKWEFQIEGHPTLFFIDGSHTYEYCKNDTERCFELCQGKGVFLWHDCDDHHPGVVQFLAEWRALGRDIRRIEGTPIAYWKSV